MKFVWEPTTEVRLGAVFYYLFSSPGVALEEESGLVQQGGQGLRARQAGEVTDLHANELCNMNYELKVKSYYMNINKRSQVLSRRS